MTTPTPSDNTGSTDSEIERNRQRAAEGWLDAIIDLAMGLRDRYRRTGDHPDLLEGIALLRTGLGGVGNHPVRYVLLSNLSSLLLDHFHEIGDLAILHEALGGCDEAIPLIDEENRLTVTSMRLEVLGLLAERTHDPAYATEAVKSASRLPPKPYVQYALGRALRTRYDLTDDYATLTEAVRVLEECVRATPADDPNYLLWLSELGNALQQSAERTGDDSVRETAIRHLRTVVARLPGPSAATLLFRKVDLAAALRDRGRQTGDLVALREGVGLLREVLTATPPASPHWVNRCENYLVAAEFLVERTGDMELLDQAVDIGGAARDQAGAGATIRLLLGLLHHRRFQRTGSRTDLEQAVSVFTEAADMVPYGEPDHVVALGSQGRVWFSQYELSGDPQALRDSVTALGSAARASTLGTTMRGEIQFNYGLSLNAQYELSMDPAVLAAAGHAFSEAAQTQALAPRERLRAARAWAQTEARARRWHRARDAYAFAVGLLPFVAPRSLARADQQRELAEFDGLAADAAASALWADDPPTAVRLLELGRGVLGGQILQSRSDISRLRTAAPDLAERLAQAFDRLAPSGQLTSVDADLRHDFELKLRRVLDEVRVLPGFTDFLAPPDLADLLISTTHGPVVLINVSRLRSDALIVQPSGITPVELPGVTTDSVADQADTFGAALAAATRPGTGETEAQTTVTGVLQWLWDFIAEPVLKQLGHLSTPSGNWPRVWWSPVGQLSLLPIHAAGRLPSSATVLDRVISCYTPTLRALGHSRQRHTRADGDLVVVAIGDAPGAKTLRGVAREASRIAALAPATRLDSTDATIAAVRAALTTHTSAHFACHATSDPDNPSAGHLLLHDGPLSVLDVSALDLTGVRLVVLSACETSLGARWIPDEGLHLVSAFQLAGYPQVVGTLWQVNDMVARLVAIDLHESVAAGEDAAVALHHAVRRCRERFDLTPTLWAAYLYSGQ
ncbi:CHAT domain-containing protein [Streptomyces niveus]|uniref:CHAT domain-containing protein n=1 Tax=Streptomyces niveus TaxID=193462 RepID=UPI00365B26B5